MKSEHGDAVFMSNVTTAIMFASILVILFELGRWGYEFLRYGEAATFSLSDVFGSISTEWVGVQRILDFLWRIDVGWIAIATGVISGMSSDYYEGKKTDLSRKMAEYARQAK